MASWSRDPRQTITRWEKHLWVVVYKSRQYRTYIISSAQLSSTSYHQTSANMDQHNTPTKRSNPSSPLLSPRTPSSFFSDPCCSNKNDSPRPSVVIHYMPTRKFETPILCTCIPVIEDNFMGAGDAARDLHLSPVSRSRPSLAMSTRDLTINRLCLSSLNLNILTGSKPCLLGSQPIISGSRSNLSSSRPKLSRPNRTYQNASSPRLQRTPHNRSMPSLHGRTNVQLPNRQTKSSEATIYEVGPSNTILSPRRPGKQRKLQPTPAAPKPAPSSPNKLKKLLLKPFSALKKKMRKSRDERKCEGNSISSLNRAILSGSKPWIRIICVTDVLFIFVNSWLYYIFNPL